MTVKKGTSNIPLVMGIIGGVLGIPASFCSGACAACIGVISSGGPTPDELGSFYLNMALMGAVIGLVGGILGKKMPTLAGILMLLAAFMSGYTLIVGNMSALIIAILFLLGGAFCFAQKKEEYIEE